jgi:acyl transferase domain-containing protein/acyl carrier protein
VSEPIAIVGMACRFPGGADSPARFWQLLIDGEDAIRELSRDGLEIDRFYDPTPRTPGRMASRWGGFLDGIELFDPGFFGISPREAATVDPSQRLLLETAWEAFEDATIDPISVAGTAVGVFVGQWVSDFEDRVFADPDQVDFHATTGSGRYGTSGRLSYVLHATGPSLTLDTACSSSLVAVHLACQSLRTGESTLALAAGVNVILEPQISIAYSQNGMMAPDGRCKFGDASGDGYVRSEGVGVVVLKRLEAAMADGDVVRAVIRGSAVNNDGGSSGRMGAPSRTGQAAMLRTAYADAAVPPHSVSYIEAHGTGTRAGDPVELGALRDVLAPGRGPGERCVVGSVKTNIGHTEGAAGVAGLIKCVLALEHELVPPSLHLHDPNPAVPWGELPFDISQRAMPWPRDPARPRIAGVSGYGISGTNAHVVLEEAPVAIRGRAPTGRQPLPLVFSAASQSGLQALARAYAEHLRAGDAPPLADLCATAARHRAALAHRAVFVDQEPSTLAERLGRFGDGETQAADAVAQARSGAPLRVAFAFPGQGGQWHGMARELLATEPAFRAAVERCDAALPAGLGWSVSGQLVAECGTDGYRMGEISVIQPVLLAVQIALAETWKSWGVVPEAVVGHSMGEVGAAHLAGALSLEAAMQIICARSALMQRTSGAGSMAVLELPADEVAERIRPHGDRVCVAVMNSPRSTVVSGDAEAITDVLAGCKRDEVFARSVKVDVASHSAHMDPLVPELVAALRTIMPATSELALYSTVDAAPRPGEAWDAAYWGRNLRQPVRFGSTVERMLVDGIDVFVEVGPHPTLLNSVAQIGEQAGQMPVTIGSLRRGAPERTSLLASLGALWAAGHPVDWEALFPAGTYDRVPLPHYPWQRERHWADTALPVPADGAARRRPALDDAARAWLHVLQWEPAPVTGASTAAAWVVVGEDDAVADAVSDALVARGQEVHRAPSLDAAAGWVPARQHRDIRVLLVPSAGARGFAPVAAAHVLHRLALSNGAGPVPRLWWATQGAHGVGERPPASDGPDQAALWGAARVVAAEHPEWWGGLLDLDPAYDAATQAGIVADHLCAGDDEDQVAIRDGARFALRVVPMTAGANDRPRWRTDAAYLISGGLGGVAQEITAAMVRDGARRLVLTGRTPLPLRTEWSDVAPGTELGRRIAAVRALEHAGASVHLLCADVADEVAMKVALERYAAEGWPPIAGVIHAAGALDNRLATDMDHESFARVVAPKLDGALVLDRLLPDLDLFVVFSSISAFWAPVGMANYAAANAGLDALAQVRRGRGQHAVSIQWGPWANVGFHERTITARSTEEMAGEGVVGFTAEQGASMFLALAGGAEPVVAVLPIDWSTFHRAARARNAPLFRSAPGAEDGLGPSADGFLARARAASPADRHALVERAVREALGRVLRLPSAQIDARRPFGSLGLDSLMALELRNRLEGALGLPLSATLAWNYPTVESLTSHLESVVVPEPTVPTDEPAATPATDVTEPSVDVETLSDDDAVALLRGAPR